MPERTVVVSQPMFLPWIGMFEQVRLADEFVHYDDVQLPQGRSFSTRVQLKTAPGRIWLTAPIDRQRSGKLISETVLMPAETWRPKHLETLRHALGRAPYAAMALDLAAEIYASSATSLAEFNNDALERVAGWFNLTARFHRSSAMGIGGASSQRLVDLCRKLGATRYVTGNGAYHYLDHGLFESQGIAVHYMRYDRTAYAQQHGFFTPYVTVLDAIANLGGSARDLLTSDTVHWSHHEPESH